MAVTEKDIKKNKEMMKICVDEECVNRRCIPHDRVACFRNKDTYYNENGILSCDYIEKPK